MIGSENLDITYEDGIEINYDELEDIINEAIANESTPEPKKKKVRFNPIPEYEPTELYLEKPCVMRDFHDNIDGNFIRVIQHPSRESFLSSVAFHYDNPAACFAERGYDKALIWSFRKSSNPGHNIHGRIGTSYSFKFKF